MLRDRAAWKAASFWDAGRENDSLNWNDLQMSFKVIKSGTSRKLAYDFLLVYSNFRLITQTSHCLSDLDKCDCRAMHLGGNWYGDHKDGASFSCRLI